MRIENIAKVTIICFALSGISGLILPGRTNNVILSVILIYSLFVLYLINYKKLKEINFVGKRYLILFLIYGLCVFIYSLFIASGYDSWNYLFVVFVPTLIFPIISIICTNLSAVISTLKALVIIAIPISLLFYFTDYNKGETLDFTASVSFIYLLIFLIPFVNKYIKILIILISTLSFFYEINDRTNLIMIFLCFSLLLVYYFRNILNFRIYVILRIFLLFIPLVFFLLATFDVYNVFNNAEDNTISKTYELYSDKSSVDTRTFLYHDVLSDLNKKNKLLFGISATGKHYSQLADEYDELNNGRLGTEVGVLQYLLRGGIIYLILFFMLIYKSSKVALFKSKNDFSKMIALYILIYWVISFIEFQPGNNMWTLSLFIAIGITFNRKIRNMRNIEIKKVLGNFLKKKRKITINSNFKKQSYINIPNVLNNQHINYPVSR